MKKIVVCFFICTLLITGTLYAETYRKVNMKESSATGLTINTKSLTGLSAVSTIGDIGLDQRNTPDGLFTTIAIDGYTKNHGPEGTPHLPVITRLIEIPFGASVTAVVESYGTEIVMLSKKGFVGKLMPVQPSLAKNTPENQKKFHYKAKAYLKDTYNTDEIVRFERIGVLRGVSVGKLTISPFRYNPGRNSLMVFNNIRFDLEYKNGDANFSEKLKRKYLSSVFKSATDSIEMLPASDNSVKAATENDSKWPLTYVIVAGSSFRGDKLNEFVQWKKTSGFKVIELYTDDDALETSTTAKLRESIKTYLQAVYDSSTPQSYVLFIGDVETIPAWPGEAESDQPHVTDLYYCTYDGSDYLPDAYYGRFPADNASDLEIMVDKTIKYEKYKFADGVDENFLDNYMFVAGIDSDFQKSHGNAQVNYATSEYFTTPFKYLAPDYENLPAGYDINDAILRDFNEGMGFVNYTGHCDETGWQNDFDKSDVAGLSENDMFGLVVGNCCLSNKFDYNDCLGETLIKKERAGAVGYIGASNNSLWDEDFYWSVGKPLLSLSESNISAHTFGNTATGVYDGQFHSGMTADQWYITAGQMIQRGNLAVSESSSSKAKYYWEIYHLMGDPSLIPFLEKPAAFSATPSVSPISTCVTTSCTVSDIEENAYVGLSQNDRLLDSAYSGADTFVSLTFSALQSTDPLTLVVTKQNKQPYINDLNMVTADSSLPEADFSVVDREIYSTTSLTFNNGSKGCNDYKWDFFGDTVVDSIEESPDFIYEKIGEFTVSLEASNGSGTHTKTEAGYIKVLPKIIPNTYDAVLGTNGISVISFSEPSTNHDEIATWEWTFSGGALVAPATISTASGLTVVYDTPGLYTASLTVTIGATPYTSNTINIRIREAAPVASFTANKTSVKVGESVQFTDTSMGSDLELFWHFNSGTPRTSSDKSLVVVFDSEGDHIVYLTIENSSGTHVAYKTISVLPSAIDPTDPPEPESSSSGGGGSCFIGLLGEKQAK